MNASCVRLAVLIDDNDIDLFVQKRFIEINRFADKVVTFRSPAEALQFFLTAEDLPEIIFLDLNMPVMDGFEFLEKYLLLPEKVTNFCKVVVLTSSSSASDRERAATFKNVIGFVSKPLSPKSLDELKVHFQKVTSDKDKIISSTEAN